MNDDDDRTDARGDAEPQSDRWRRGASDGSRQDQFPVRNTAPAGTPVHKLPVSTGSPVGGPAALPLGAPIAPEQLGPPPVVTSTSDRPPSVETMTQARTVGGHTARLKVPGAQDDEMPRTRGRRVPPAPQRHAEDEPPPSGRNGGDRPAPRSARGAALRREGPANWEAEVKFSEPDLPAAKAKALEPVDPSESRWPFAIALGAVAFAIGSLLPLPFRKYIVGSAPEATQSQPATIPLPAPVHSAAPAPPTTAATGAHTTATAATSTSAAPAPSAAAPAAAASAKAATVALVAPSVSASAGKRPPGGKGGKGGHIGDIF